MRLSALSACACIRCSAAQAQDTIKIGLIMPYSGQFADTAVQMDNGIKLYVQRHGRHGRRQEDRVHPQGYRRCRARRGEAAGAGNGGARRRRYPRGLRADAECAGCRRCLGLGEEIDGDHECRHLDHHDQVALFGAHLDHAAAGCRNARRMGGEEWHRRRSIRWCRISVRATMPNRASSAPSRKRGGEIIGSVRFPVANPDFSAFVQRAKDLNPEAIFLFVPAGAQPAAFAKALAERGLDPKTTSRCSAPARSPPKPR